MSPVTRPMVITLIGSTRFEPLFGLWTEALTVCAGHAVFDLAVRGKTGQDWYDADTRERLVASRRLKIDRSDAVLLIDHGGYVGGLSDKERQRAEAMGKLCFRMSSGTSVWSLLPHTEQAKEYLRRILDWRPETVDEAST